MNRVELLEMLERLAEVPSVELKMNVPADQRMALSGLHLDAMQGRLREVYFFDTPDLRLYHHGVVVRARRTQDAEDDTVVKLRPAAPEALSPTVRASKNLKLEMDVTVLVVLLKFVPEGLPRRSTIEQWHYPGEVPLVELSTKATPQNVLQVLAEGMRVVRAHGLAASGAQEPKTRRALEFFARHHPARSQKDG